MGSVISIHDANRRTYHPAHFRPAVHSFITLFAHLRATCSVNYMYPRRANPDWNNVDESYPVNLPRRFPLFPEPSQTDVISQRKSQSIPLKTFTHTKSYNDVQKRLSLDVVARPAEILTCNHFPKPNQRYRANRARLRVSSPTLNW